MKIPAITIDLDDDQIDAMEPMIERAIAAADADAPGMLLAHIFPGAMEMKVFFATNEQARLMQAAMGSPVGKTTADVEQQS